MKRECWKAIILAAYQNPNMGKILLVYYQYLFHEDHESLMSSDLRLIPKTIGKTNDNKSNLQV